MIQIAYSLEFAKVLETKTSGIVLGLFLKDILGSYRFQKVVSCYGVYKLCSLGMNKVEITEALGATEYSAHITRVEAYMKNYSNLSNSTKLLLKKHFKTRNKVIDKEKQTLRMEPLL
jgi:hypothetical protein